MTRCLHDIEGLLRVLETAFQAEQLAMVKVNRHIVALSTQLRGLERPEAPAPLSPATLAGVDLRWEAWAQDRKKAINQELALAYHDRDRARLSMTAALSKLEAARQVRSQAKSEAEQLALRRASW